MEKLSAKLGLDIPQTEKVVEFNMSGTELQLRTYRKNDMGREVKGSREVLWSSTNWHYLDSLLWQYDLTKSFEELLNDAQNTLKHHYAQKKHCKH